MKFNIWQIVSLILALALMFNGCQYFKLKDKTAKLEKDCAERLVKADTVTITKTDTVREVITAYVPKVQKVDIVRYSKNIDTFIRYVQNIDTCKELALKHYRINSISDTQNITAGRIIINDEVTLNNISKRSIQTDIEQKTITSTITKTVEAKRRNELYMGLGAGYYDTRIMPLVSFDMINKKGSGAGVFGGYMNGQFMYGGKALFKLSTRRK